METPTRATTGPGPLSGLVVAAGMAAAWGALVGAYELIDLLPGTRYASWAGRVGLVALGADAGVAALLSLPCFLVAWIVPPGPREAHARARLAATAAGLGLFAIVVVGESPLHLPIAALGLTLAAFARPGLERTLRPWARALPGVVAVGVGVAHVLGGYGSWVSGAALALGLAASLVAAARPGLARVAGLVGWLAALAVPLSLAFGPNAAASSAPPAASGPNVVLVTFDTTRVDYIGCYGKQDAHTPTWDRFAREGVLFADATAQANVTGPSHATMLTGRFPPEHGSISNGEPLRHDVRTISELLGRAGWSTGAFVSGFTLDDRMCGLAARFDHYDDDLFAWPIPRSSTRIWLVRHVVRWLEAGGADLERGDRPAGEVVDAALAWLDERDPTRPFFLWAHFYDPHAPYEPPPPFDSLADALDGARDAETNWYRLDTDERRALIADPKRVRDMLAAYEGEIAYADAQLERLRAALTQRGHADDTLWVLTADHGEGFGEHDYWFDHVWLYEAELRVPLVVRWPGGERAGTRVEAPVRLVDLAPTIASACALDGGEVPFDGVDLTPLARAAGSGSAEGLVGLVPAFGRIEGEFGGYELGGLQTSVRQGRFKLIEFTEHWLDSQRVPGRQELYALDVDPTEQHDLLLDPDATVPSELEGLRERLSFWRERAGAIEARRDHTPEELEALRALGYL